MTMRRYPSGIVGLPYPNRDGVPCYAAVAILQAGDVVQLEREPSNRFDSGAIAVLFEGRHLGYAPKRQTSWIGEQLDEGRAITATVSEIHRRPDGRVVTVDLDIDLERRR